MPFTSNNKRHRNSEILAVLDEAKIAASEGDTGRVSSLLSVASAFKGYLEIDGAGFIVEKTYKERDYNALVDRDDEV